MRKPPSPLRCGVRPRVFLSVVVLVLGAGVAGCGAAPRTACPGGGAYHEVGGCLIPPTEAVIRAAEAAPKPVAGVFGLRVRATGWQNGVLYLNSETDYRDQRNLSVSIPPQVAAHLRQTYGVSDLESYFKGRRIAVDALAYRKQIWFVAENGAPTDKYYYQTHVMVEQANQLTVLPD